MIALASNIFAPMVPPRWGISLAIIGFLLWLYSLSPVEAWAQQRIKTNTISSIVVLLFCVGIILVPAIEGISSFRRLHENNTAPPAPTPTISVPASQPDTSLQRRASVPTQTSSPPHERGSRSKTDTKDDPCPNGYTILHDVTASKSSWDHAKTTGFYFDGANPCLKIENGKSIDNDTGYQFSGSQQPTVTKRAPKITNTANASNSVSSPPLVNNEIKQSFVDNEGGTVGTLNVTNSSITGSPVAGSPNVGVVKIQGKVTVDELNIEGGRICNLKGWNAFLDCIDADSGYAVQIEEVVQSYRTSLDSAFNAIPGPPNQWFTSCRSAYEKAIQTVLNNESDEHKTVIQLRGKRPACIAP